MWDFRFRVILGSGLRVQGIQKALDLELSRLPKRQIHVLYVKNGFRNNYLLYYSARNTPTRT